MDRLFKHKSRLIFLFSFSFFVCLPLNNAETSFRERSSLLRRIMQAEAVIVGRLVEVKKSAILIRQYDQKGKEIHIHLDTGLIQGNRLLNSAQGIEKKEVIFPFASYSRHQPQPYGYEMHSPLYLHFDEGDEGIWIVRRDAFTGRSYINSPENFLPLNSLGEVERVVEKFFKIISDKP